MKRQATWILPLIIVAWYAAPSTNGVVGPGYGGQIQAADDGDAPRPSDSMPSTTAEARGRARLLHETIHGALQVIHRDLFREDEQLMIPSRSLEDVFRELARKYKVEVRWLAVNTEAMNVDHKARTDFERKAVAALANGDEEFESSADGVYRHAGAIRLSSRCLKCHVPNRTNTDDRAAGLVITMPVEERKRESQ